MRQWETESQVEVAQRKESMKEEDDTEQHISLKAVKDVIHT